MAAKERPLAAASGRPPRTDFAKFVATLPKPGFRLGLTHVTTGYILRDIIDASSIFPPEKCPIFNEPLVYAFYGRAAFRRQDDGVPTDMAYMFPALLILDPSAVPTPKYVFGFDSGAFVRRYMDQYLDPYMPLLDFQLETNIESAERLISAFFGTAESFLKNEPTGTTSIPHGNYEAVSYGKLLMTGGHGPSKLDDRVSTPELIFPSGLDLAACVRGAIVPDALASDPTIGGRLKNLGIAVREYEWTGVSRPSEYHMLIRQIAKGLYKDFGWL